MKLNYFVYNGNTYYSGTEILIKKWDFYCYVRYPVSATFIEHDVERKEYVLKIYDEECRYSERDFFFNLCRVIKPHQIEKSTKIPKKTHTFMDELRIDALCIAWAWYIFIMVIGTIFYDRLMIWGFATFVFGLYRDEKLKEAGLK